VMYTSFGKCGNYRSNSVHAVADCRNCKNHDPTGNEYKVGDWCKNFSGKIRPKSKSDLIKPKAKLINPKDYNARRV